MIKNKTVLLLLLIVALAGFLRFWQLDKLPPGLYPDEAANGVNALQVLDNADFKVFYPENNGREGFFINLQALSVQVFGTTPWALRAVSALVGTLTILIFYFLLKELSAHIKKIEIFENLASTNFALLGAFLLAVNSWHIHFSRIGFRAITLPFLLSLAALFLLRAIRTRKTKEFIISGFWWGLGFYSYIGFRLAPLFGLVIFIFDSATWFLKKEVSFKKFLTQYIILGISVLITALPILGYFLSHPEDVSSRSSPISVFAAENPIIQLAISLGQTAIMFNLVGDWNWRHNAAGSSMLTYISGILFLVGILILIKAVIKSIKQKDLASSFPLVFVGAWFVVMLMPSFLTREGMPHALRSIGAIPAVIIFSTIGLVWIWKRFAANAKLAQKANFLLLIILVAISVENLHKYFIAWGQNEALPYAFRQDLTKIGDFLNAYDVSSGASQKYIIVNEYGVELNGIPVPSATIRFITGENPDIHYLKPEQLSQIQVDPENPIMVVFTAPNDSNLENELYKLFPSVQKIQEQIIYYKII